jgi:hypothetical protein
MSNRVRWFLVMLAISVGGALADLVIGGNDKEPTIKQLRDQAVQRARQNDDWTDLQNGK